MKRHAGVQYPNGKGKSWLLEIFLSARDFACSLEAYADDLAFVRIGEAQAQPNCRWIVEDSGRRFVEGLEFADKSRRLEIVENGFRFVPAKDRVFISYAKEDSRAAGRLYRDLQLNGAQPWMDTKNLKPGQRWQAEIEEEIANCTHFIALLSSRAVTKRGYVQSEIRRALEIWERLPDRTLFLIPTRLDDCEPSHSALNAFHRVDLFPNWKKGVAQILRSLGLSDA